MSFGQFSFEFFLGTMICAALALVIWAAFHIKKFNLDHVRFVAIMLTVGAIAWAVGHIANCFIYNVHNW